MNTIMNDEQIKTLAQVRAFLDGTQAVEFSLNGKQGRYEFIRRSLILFNYYRLSRPDKGLLFGFMTHVSGYSRIQVERLNGGNSNPAQAQAVVFPYGKSAWKSRVFIGQGIKTVRPST